MLGELPARHHDQPPATDNCPIELTGTSLTVQKTEVICHLPCVQKEGITSAHLRKIISSFIYATENKMLKKSNWQDSPRVGLGYTPEIPYEAPKNNDTSDCTLVRFFFSNMIQVMFHWEEEVSIEKVPMEQYKSVGAISLLMTLCGRARPTVVLGGIGK